MEHGFEFVSAKPKKAAEDEPYAENMRGQRKITKNPSTDQKKVRRAQQRKTAMEASVEFPEDIEIEAGIRDWFSGAGDRLRNLDDRALDAFHRADDAAYSKLPDFVKHPTERKGFDPLGQSGLPGYDRPDSSQYQAPAAPERAQYTCPQCHGSAQGFYGEPCPSCRGTGMRIDASKTANLRCPQCDSWSLSDKPEQCADCKIDMVPEQGHPSTAPEKRKNNPFAASKTEMDFMSAIAKRAKRVLDTPEGEL